MQKDSFRNFGEAYEKLNHSFVIFICTFDLFQKDYYKYTFVNKCDEVEGLELEDGTTTIFMNTEGHKGDISEDCKVFLKGIKGQFTENEFSAILEKEVEKIKKNKKWRKEYMFLSMWLRDEQKKAEQEGLEKGLKQGLEQGLEQGRAEAEKRAIKNMLKKISVDEIIQLGYESELVKKIAEETEIN